MVSGYPLRSHKACRGHTRVNGNPLIHRPPTSPMMEQMKMPIRTRFLAATAAALLLWCTGCASHLKSGGAATGGGSSHSTPTRDATSPLARTRLAPGTVGTPAAGMHCHMTGTSPTTYRPDPACTPGTVEDTVTQNNIDSTICVTGYTTKIRPPAAATDKVKRDMYAAYGLPDSTASELDHLVSLELGGSNDPRNLWVEPGSLPNPKDTVENALHKAVCAHKVTLAAAQEAIATNWTTALAVTGAGK